MGADPGGNDHLPSPGTSHIPGQTFPAGFSPWIWLGQEMTLLGSSRPHSRTHLLDVRLEGAVKAPGLHVLRNQSLLPERGQGEPLLHRPQVRIRGFSILWEWEKRGVNPTGMDFGQEELEQRSLHSQIHHHEPSLAQVSHSQWENLWGPSCNDPTNHSQGNRARIQLDPMERRIR